MISWEHLKYDNEHIKVHFGTGPGGSWGGGAQPKSSRPVAYKGLLTFLSTADNKRQLISVLLKVWGSDLFAYKLKNRHVMCICEGDAFLLSSNDGKKIVIKEIQELSSLQEETN